jgi:hypothetical protein
MFNPPRYSSEAELKEKPPEAKLINKPLRVRKDIKRNIPCP